MATILFDVLPDVNIFTAISNIKAFPWADVISPAQMDVTYKQLYGGKRISKFTERILNGNSVLSDDNLNAIANVLYNMYYDKWSLAYTLYEAQLKSANAGYTETSKETITKDFTNTDTGTVNNDNTNTDKISAFDTGDFENKSQTSINGTDTRDLQTTQAGTQTTEYEKNGFSISYNNYLEKAYSLLQKNLLYDIIFVDANSVLSIHNYDL